MDIKSQINKIFITRQRLGMIINLSAVMIEQQYINDKNVWIKIEALNQHRDNPNVIPTEYFIASYYLDEPSDSNSKGESIKDADGTPKQFESPVAALSNAEKVLEKIL